MVVIEAMYWRTSHSLHTRSTTIQFTNTIKVRARASRQYTEQYDNIIVHVYVVALTTFTSHKSARWAYRSIAEPSPVAVGLLKPCTPGVRPVET